VTYTESPFINFALPSLWSSLRLREKVSKEYSNIPCVQLFWENDFDYIVVKPLPAETSTDHFRAESHYYFALNILYWMGNFKTGAFHIKRALKLNPESKKYKLLAGFYCVLTIDLKGIYQTKPGLSIIIKALICRIIQITNKILSKLYKKILNFLII